MRVDSCLFTTVHMKEVEFVFFCYILGEILVEPVYPREVRPLQQFIGYFGEEADVLGCKIFEAYTPNSFGVQTFLHAMRHLEPVHVSSFIQKNDLRSTSSFFRSFFG